ncbi:glycosyltransferase family protein [bacterium]|nr:glycosyltransferase family protein [bacterium]
MSNIICIIQARTGSSRLKNKIFLDLEGKPVLSRVIDRVSKSKLIDKIVIASPESVENNIIEEFVNKNYPKVGVSRGSENDVLDRYYQAAKKFNAEIIVRITSDCPLMDTEILDKVIKKFIEKKVDYVANVLGKRTYPRGLDVEVFAFKTLEKIWKEAKDSEDREHVTLYLRKRPELFLTYNVENDEDYSKYRLTLDEDGDYKLISLIYKNLLIKDENFDLKDIIKLLKTGPKLAEINNRIKQKHAKY